MSGSDIGKRTASKTARRTLPFLFLLYIVAFLDRINLSYAALKMNCDLGLSPEFFGFVSGVFFLGYFIFEVPSNVMLHRFGAKVWIARILVSWGAIAALTGLVHSGTQLAAMRFLLGIGEAGFFPGVILYLTYWFRAADRARAVALFMTAIAVSSVIGAPLSTWIMDNVSWFGVAGWRWMFVLEGVPAALLGVASYFLLCDSPSEAKWLSPEEKEWLCGELEKERASVAKASPGSMLRVFSNPKALTLCFFYFTLTVGLYGLGFWLPQIVKAARPSYSDFHVGIAAMGCYAAAAVCMTLWAKSSDRTGERHLHAAAALALFATALFIAQRTASSFAATMALLAIANAGLYSAFGPFWSLPSAFLAGKDAAVGIAFINSVGNIGGFVGPFLVGWLMDLTGTMQSGFNFVCALVMAGALSMVWLRYGSISAQKRQASDQICQ